MKFGPQKIINVELQGINQSINVIEYILKHTYYITNP